MSWRFRAALWLAAGFACLQVGWLLAMPPFEGIDEVDHVYRAASVAAGHWEAGGAHVDRDLGRGELIWVPTDIAKAARDTCETLRYMRPANCRPQNAAVDGEVQMASAAARYNPLYYALVGSVALPFSGDAAVSAMRVCSSLLCLLLLLAAGWSTTTWARGRWPFLALAIAITPTTIYSTTIVAPNGLQLCAGVLLWTSLIGWLGHDQSARRRAGLAVLATVAVTVLAGTHSLGLLWVGLTALVALGCFGFQRLRSHARTDRRVLALCAGIALAGATASAGWIVAAGTNAPSSEGISVPGSYFPGGFVQAALWPLQAIGAIPTRGNIVPLTVYAIWLALTLALALPALRAARAQRRLLNGLLISMVLSFAVPTVLSWLTFSQIGYAWQGRYGMPFTAGVFLLCGLALDRSSRFWRMPALVFAILVVLLLVAHLVSEEALAGRMASSSVWADGSRWHRPELWLLVVLAVVAVGCWSRASTVLRVEDRAP